MMVSHRLPMNVLHLKNTKMLKNFIVILLFFSILRIRESYRFSIGARIASYLLKRDVFEIQSDLSAHRMI